MRNSRISFQLQNFKGTVTRKKVSKKHMGGCLIPLLLIKRFINYHNLYNRTIRAAKKMYYDKQFVTNQSNVKSTWELFLK
jgi:hypothetical protein